MQIRYIIGSAAGLACLAACSSGASKPMPRAKVAAIVADCSGAIADLNAKLGSGDKVEAYNAARSAQDQCGPVQMKLAGAAGVSEACQGIGQLGDAVGSAAADALDDGKPSNLARLGGLSQDFEGQLKTCEASFG